jgi:hypothetical protein
MRAALPTAAVAHPFLHVEAERVYHPLTDRALTPADPLYRSLRALLDDPAADVGTADRARLEAEAWLAPEGSGPDPARQFLLKYVSLEAHTLCNQACYFCPVSIAPREAYFMPTELYERIVGELAFWKETIEAVFMINYNEPTADRRFVDQVASLKRAGLPPAVLTNGTGLSPQRVDALLALGGLRFLSINLSTLDRERYSAERGGDHLGQVLKHLDYASDKPLAEQMDVVVLGTGDELHRRDFAEITERFAHSRFTVKSFEVMDRAGYLQIGHKPASPAASLCGCDNVGSRPLQHLHVTPRGKCVLCCEDYDEKYVVGDLSRQSVREVLTGPALALMRRWAYGVEQAPADFICRGCTFARKKEV